MLGVTKTCLRCGYERIPASFQYRTKGHRIVNSKYCAPCREANNKTRMEKVQASLEAARNGDFMPFNDNDHGGISPLWFRAQSVPMAEIGLLFADQLEP